jgi:hypothetical protein
MRIYFIIFFTLYSSWVAAVEGQEQFDDAYKKFWSKPVENWNAIAASKKTENYVIRKKDTLSELSEVFFGTPNYWPKIWSVNNYIGNPHLIYPGNSVGFYMGSTEGSGPQVFLSENQQVKSTSSIYALDDPEAKLPPEPEEPLFLDVIPDSFPEWQSLGPNKDGIVDSNEVERQFSKLDKNVMMFNLSSFLHQGDLRTYGTVEGFLNAEFDAAGSFDQIYIKRNEPLPVGSVFTIVMPRKNVKTPEGRVLKDIRIFEYIAEVQIIGDEDEKSGLVPGRISRSYDMVLKDAVLISGRVPKYDLSYNLDDLQPVDAKILRGSDIFGHNIMGVGQTVFISQGEKQGVTAGSLVQIKQNRKVRNPYRGKLDIVNKIGVIKIVSSTPDVSTGIVVSSRDFMAPGDTSIE